ncbi:ABC transporter permease [Xylophilus sp. ASV27]|uniref:ABC transporter permease n=1 Tax=Xylophilus sp. ASV27 TaxID=2795129 RepID=UPI0018ED572B|nr:ABC transporter permease [Xylophilus sp. ASV27]
MRIERRERVPATLWLAGGVGACLLLLALGSLLIHGAGAPVLASWLALLKGAFGSRLAISEVLTRSTPLILTGLACAVAFRAQLWNIGAEGQLYAGALTVAALGSGALSLPSWLLLPTLLLAGAAAGGAYLLGPALLKRFLNVDDVVTTLLLNFVMALLVSLLIQGPMHDPLSMGWPQTAPLVDDGMLPRLMAQSRLHAGLLIALACALLVALVEARSSFGLQRRAVGLNAKAARFAGISTTRIAIWTALWSGGLAGLAGAVEVMGLRGYVTGDLSPGFGYTGVIIAMLARLHPGAVPLAAFVVAAVFVGADAMGRAFNVPSYIADVMVALSLFVMLGTSFLLGYRIKK